MPNFRVYVYISRNGEFDFEVHFETSSRRNGVSAHAHVTKSRKRRKMPLKCSLKAEFIAGRVHIFRLGEPKFCSRANVKFLFSKSAFRMSSLF